jgi:phosphate-selective porin OprO and OprP
MIRSRPRHHSIPRAALVAGLLSAAGSVRAQDEASPAPGASPVLASGTTPTAGAPATGATRTLAQVELAGSQFLALQAQLAQVEQRARSAEQRAQAAEQKVEAVGRSPLVGADDKGFLVRSPDGSFALKIKGLLAFDGRAYAGDATPAGNSGFLLRKIRPIFEATVLGFADVRFMPDFAGSRLVVFDAFVDVRPAPWFKIRAGKFIAPVGLERNQQDTEVAFIERSLTSNLTQVRDIGLVAFTDIAGGLFHLAGGVVNGGPDNANLDLESNKGKDLVSRLWIQPFKLPSLSHLGALALGISGSTGTHRGATVADQTALGPLVTPGQTTFFQYFTGGADPAAIVHADGTHRRLNPQLFYYGGPVGLLAEYSLTEQRVARGDTAALLTHRAWHVTPSFVLGGKPTFNGVTAIDRFAPSEGHFGALEVAVRFGQLAIDDGAFPTFADPLAWASQAREIGGHASYYFSRNLKISLDYERTTFDAAPGVDRAALARQDERVFLGRTQFYF